MIIIKIIITIGYIALAVWALVKTLGKVYNILNIKKKIRKRYSKIAKSDWFLKAYKDKNLDDAITIDNI